MFKQLIFAVSTAAFMSQSQAAVPPASVSTVARETRYYIQPTDRLELQYRYSPEYNQTLVVQPDGFVSVDLIGTLKIAGLTMDQAQALLLDKLSARLNDPEITLTLEEYVRPAFIVAGQVASPGHYELHGNVTAIEAIALAGGFKDNTPKTSKVILFRRITPDLAETHILNLKRISDPSHPHLEESVTLRAGDLLLVPQNTVSKIERFIKWVNVGILTNPVP